MENLLSTPAKRIALIAAIVGFGFGIWWKYHDEPPGSFEPPLGYTVVDSGPGGIWFLPEDAVSEALDGGAAPSETEGPESYTFRYFDGNSRYLAAVGIDCPLGFNPFDPRPPNGIRELGLTICNAAGAPPERLDELRSEMREAALFHYRRFLLRIVNIGLAGVFFAVAAGVSILAVSRLSTWVLSGK